VRRAKEKIDAGADYIVTQMFFDNRHFFRYLDLCREAGITAPIIPGLKILTTEKQLASIPRTFFVEIPAALSDEVLADPAHAQEIGVEWAVQQSEELLARGVPSLHFYVMQSAAAIKKLMGRLKL
jgi:methylenetetrahydrofolate reductase (NADPH)